jgi:hypothetical protein
MSERNLRPGEDFGIDWLPREEPPFRMSEGKFLPHGIISKQDNAVP